MEVFLVLNGYEIDASADEQEQVVLQFQQGTWSVRHSPNGSVLML